MDMGTAEQSRGLEERVCVFGESLHKHPINMERSKHKMAEMSSSVSQLYSEERGVVAASSSFHMIGKLER